MDFLKKTLNTFFLQGFAAVFGLLSSAILARALGAGDLGSFRVLSSVPEVIAVLMTACLCSANVYFIAKEPGARRQDIGNNLLYWVGASLIFLPLWYFLVPVANHFYYRDRLPLGLLYAAGIFVPLLLFKKLGMTILKGLYQIEAFNWITLFVDSAGRLILYSILLLGLKWGLGGAVISFFILHGIINALLAKKIVTQTGVSFAFSLPHLKRSMNFGWKSYVGGITRQLAGSLEILLIPFFLPMVTVGLFVVARRVASLLGLVLGSVERPLLPKISASSQQEAQGHISRLLRIQTTGVLIATPFLLWILPKFTLLLYGKDYEGAVIPLLVLFPGMVCESLTTAVATHFLGTNQPWPRFYVFFTYLVALAILLPLLAWQYGLLGVCVSVSLAKALSVGFGFWLLLKSAKQLRWHHLIVVNRHDVRYLNEIFRQLWRSVK